MVDRIAPITGPTGYDYGRTPGLFDIAGLLDAFTPTRREIISPSQTRFEEMDGLMYPVTTPAVYGEPETGIEYMPAYRAASSAADFIGGLLTGGDEEREMLVEGAKAVPGALAGQIDDYYTAMTQTPQGASGLVTPEGEVIEANPLLPMEYLLGGSIGAMRAGDNVLGAAGGRLGDGSAGRIYTDPVTGARVTEADISLMQDLPVLGSEHFPVESLLGAEVRPFLADRMDAGRFYSGFAESPLETDVPLQGGDKYPLMASSLEDELAFASLGEGTATNIAGGTGPRRFAVITQMGEEAHRSNKTIGGRVIPMQVRAFIRDGIISPDQSDALTALIRSKSTKKRSGPKDPETGESKTFGRLASFPGYNSPEIFSYMDSLDFETRGEIAKILGSAEAQKLNAPDIGRILRETISPEAAGMSQMQGGILVELDDLPTAALKGTSGSHISYDFATKGRPVARIPQGADAEVFFEELFTKLRAEGRPESNFPYLLGRYMPKETMGEGILGRLPTAADADLPLYSRRQARLLVDTLRGNWRTTDVPVNQRGLSPTEVSQAIENNAMSASLTPYSVREITAGAKDGSLKFYGLGAPSVFSGKQTGETGGKIYFGLKSGTDYNKEYGFSHPDLTDNEVAVVGLINNEVGGSAKGVAGPSAILKGIEEGATVLDAYAVPSKKNPQGFLPRYYSEFGFEELGRVPFEEKYVRDPEFGGSEQKYQKLLSQWKASGWDESMGMPELTIMKWRGDDEIRTGATQRFITEGGTNFGGQNQGIVAGARSQLGEPTGADVGVPQGGRIEGDAGGNRGRAGDGDRTNFSGGFQRAFGAIPSLSPGGRLSLGLLDEDVAEVQSLLGVR